MFLLFLPCQRKTLGETSPPNKVKYGMIHCQGRRFKNFPTNQNTKKTSRPTYTISLGVSLCIFLAIGVTISKDTYNTYIYIYIYRHVSQFLMELELALQDFTSLLLGLCRNFSTINFSYFEDCLAFDSSKLQENSLTSM